MAVVSCEQPSSYKLESQCTRVVFSRIAEQGATYSFVNIKFYPVYLLHFFIYL